MGSSSLASHRAIIKGGRHFFLDGSQGAVSHEGQTTTLSGHPPHCTLRGVKTKDVDIRLYVHSCVENERRHASQQKSESESGSGCCGCRSPVA
eukprot:scaffold353_cov185-Amphora_coffeaeformis.AAC.88